VGRAAQMNPRIQGITSQQIKIPILMLEDGDVICAGDIPPPLSFDEEARRPLARMVPGVGTERAIACLRHKPCGWIDFILKLSSFGKLSAGALVRPKTEFPPPNAPLGSCEGGFPR